MANVARAGRLFRNAHKVSLVKSKGVAEPGSEIKHLARAPTSNSNNAISEFNVH